MQDPEVEELFFGGSGKGEGKRSSGKGKDRRKNPIDSATGEPMKCHTCGADDHLAARCNNRSGGGHFLTHTPTYAIADSFFFRRHIQRLTKQRESIILLQRGPARDVGISQFVWYQHQCQ